MTQEGHLQVFDLTMETRGPLFIGCGKSYTKKEYLFDPRANTVSFLDERRFFSYMARHGLADAYESFILDGMSKNLLSFLQNTCKLPQSEINGLVRCRIDAGDALDDSHTLKEIRRFIRNGSGQIYVPGSSIKGALRTVLLTDMILQSPPAHPSADLPFDQHASFEDAYFHTLSLKKNKAQQVMVSNPLNSLLQGVRISDSVPLADRDLCLTRKIDEFPDGTYNAINICRECVKPGVRICCKLTLDQSVLRGSITEDSIRKAIADFSEFYQKSVLLHYPKAGNQMNSKTILLGGGAGFQSKTVVGPYYGEEALNLTSRILKQRFSRHFHEKDPAGGVSPRALKQTDFNNASYPYGVCEVTIR